MNKILPILMVVCISMYTSVYAQTGFKSSVDPGISLDNYTSLSMGIVELTDGKFIVNTGGVSESALFMINPMGKAGWSKNLEDTQFSGILNATHLLNTSDGGYLLTAAGSDHRMYKLLKFKEDGTLDWSRYIGRGNERNGSTFETADGGIILVGQTVVSTFGLTDIFVAKLDSRGLLLWAKNFGTNLYERGYAAFEAENGDILLHTHQGLDITPGLVRISADGELISSINFNNIQGLGVENRAMTRLAGGDLLLRTSVGPPTYATVLTRVTEQGEVVWSYKQNTGARLLRTTPTADGGFLGLGTIYYQPNSRLEPLLMKFDEDGFVVWSHALGILPGDARFIKELDQGDIILGFEDSQTDSVSIFMMDSSGVICDYNPVNILFEEYTVQPESYSLMEGSGAQQGENEVALEELYVDSERYCALFTATEDIQTVSLEVYPNPTDGFLQIQGPHNLFSDNALIKISNSSGVDVTSSVERHVFGSELNFSNLPAGVYFIEIIQGDIRYLAKVIKVTL